MKLLLFELANFQSLVVEVDRGTQVLQFALYITHKQTVMHTCAHTYTLHAHKHTTHMQSKTKSNAYTQQPCKTQLLSPGKPILGYLCTTQVLEPCAVKSSWSRASSNPQEDCPGLKMRGHGTQTHMRAQAHAHTHTHTQCIN